MEPTTSLYIWIGGVIFLMAILLVFLPIGLEWLAQRNGRSRTTLRRDTAKLQARIQQLQTAANPFDNATAPVYRQRLDSLNADLDAMAATTRQIANTQPTLPAIPADLWLAPHFLRHPAAVAAILRDWALLRGASQQLQTATQQANHAADLLHQLDHLPAELRRACASLQTKITALAQAIAAEHAAGTANLGALPAQQQQLAAQTEQLAAALAAPQLTAVAADPLAAELDTRTSQLTALENALAAHTQQRQTYQQSRETAAAAIAAASSSLQSFTRQPLVATINNEGHAALSAADNAARQAQWQQADRQLAAVTHWAKLGEAVARPLTAVSQITPLATTSLQTDTIYNARAHLEDELDALHITLAPDNRPFDWWQTVVSPRLDTLAELATTADTLHQQYHKDRRDLEQSAKQAKRLLEQAWRALQRHITLAASDSLRSRYSDVLNRFQHTADDPQAWATLNHEARILAADLQETTRYLEMRLQQLAELRSEMPNRVSEAESLAGDWRCLQDELLVVKETAVFLQQFTAQQRSTEWIGELHTLLDTAKQQWRQAATALDTLRRDGERLHSLNDRVIRIWETLSDDDPEANHMRQDMVRRVVETYLDSAYNAIEQADAIHALQQAESYLEKLV